MSMGALGVARVKADTLDAAEACDVRHLLICSDRRELALKQGDAGAAVFSDGDEFVLAKSDADSEPYLLEKLVTPAADWADAGVALWKLVEKDGAVAARGSASPYRDQLDVLDRSVSFKLLLLPPPTFGASPQVLVLVGANPSINDEPNEDLRLLAALLGAASLLHMGLRIKGDELFRSTATV